MLILRRLLQKAGPLELGESECGWEILPPEVKGTVGVVEQVPAGVDSAMWFTRRAIEAISKRVDESESKGGRLTIPAELFDQLFA
jgi:hypothetical protein